MHDDTAAKLLLLLGLIVLLVLLERLARRSGD